MERHTHNGVDSNFLKEDLLYNKGTNNGDVAVRRGVNVKKVNWENIFNNALVTAWNYVQDDNSGTVTVTGGSWSKHKQLTWNDVDGTVNLSILVQGTGVSRDDVEVRFYKNGSILSDVFTNGGSDETFTYDNVTVTKNDTLEVWARVSGVQSSRTHLYNFKISYIKVFKANV